MPRRHLAGWVFDAIPGPDGMTVWFRAESWETVPLLAPFRPSFVLAGKNLKEASLRAASTRWNCSLARGEGTEFFSGRAIPAWTFTVSAPLLLGSIVRKAEKALRPGSKIRYLLADGKGRAMGFLDGNEMPDFSRYEEMLREAEEELLGPVRGHDAPAR